jgi:hypothetical protein
MILQGYQRSKRAWEGAGIQSHRPGEILAREMDAIITIETEQVRLDNARMAAEYANSPRGSQDDE